MKPQTCLRIVLILASLLPGWNLSWAQTHRAEQERTAQNLATLLNVGRLVVERNQPLINDPRKGDKGFTPEAFEHQVIEEFLRQTAIDLNRLPSDLPALAKIQLPLLLRTSKEVVADAQFVINQRGIGYKNFIPATFGSQAARKFSNRSHVTIKQTALNPRSLKNLPDPYEEQILKRLATQPAANTPVTEWVDDGKILRTVTPIYYSQDCLVCHGEPKGMLDISGYLREGARDGDLAGAISIQIPLNNP
jgi:hypothetical protein